MTILKNTKNIFKVSGRKISTEQEQSIFDNHEKLANETNIYKINLPDVTKFTIKKIMNNLWGPRAKQVQVLGIDKQTAENLDNGFITNVALEQIILLLGELKNNGKFRNEVFETRSKQRWICNLLFNLLKNFDKKYV